MLNPFRGVLQTIEAENTNAASIDGQRWGLYISDASNYNFIDMNSVAPFHSAEVKYGEWSEKAGLKRSPSLPSMNRDRVRELGESILDMVKIQSKNIPFPLADFYERWLLDDKQGRPVVLLESAYDAAEVKYNSNTVWRIGQLALREFTDIPGPDGNIITRAAEQLQLQINRLCKQGNTIWVQREADGGAILLARPSDTQKTEQRLSVEEFPVHGLRVDWPDELLSYLSRKYLHWLSPWLLLMTNSDDMGVEHLLLHAVQYPGRLYQVRGLLPEGVLARKEVKAALVQAELNRSA